MATLDEYITAHDDTATTPEADAPDWAVIGERVAAGDARCIVILADAAGGTATTARGFTITEMNVALVASALRLAEHLNAGARIGAQALAETVLPDDNPSMAVMDGD